MALEGFGITLAFQSGFFAEITAANRTGMKREAYDKTHNLSPEGWKEFFFSRLKDAGALEITFWYDPSLTPPIDQAAETATITFPVPDNMTTGATISCTAGMTDFSATGPHDGLMQGTSTLKFSGKPTVTAAT
jgi:hypothetical protein